MSESRWFGKTMIELPSHIRAEIFVEFPIDYRPASQQMEDLIKSSLKATTSKPGHPTRKPIHAKFFERKYKVRAVTVFPALAVLVLRQPSLDLTWGQFMKEDYLFDKDNLYITNISLLISLSPKLESIFSMIQSHSFKTASNTSNFLITFSENASNFKTDRERNKSEKNLENYAKTHVYYRYSVRSLLITKSRLKEGS